MTKTEAPGTPDGTAFINSMLGGNILALNGPVPGSVILSSIGLASTIVAPATASAFAATASIAAAR